MRISGDQNKICNDLPHMEASSPPEALTADKNFGIAFIGEVAKCALNGRTVPSNLSPCIHRTFFVETAFEASCLDASDIDFVFLIVKIDTDLPLAALIATTLQVQRVFTCCIALSRNEPIRAQPLEGLSRNADAYRKASKVLIPLSCSDDQGGISDAVQVCTRISKSTLDARLIGVDFDDLCYSIFQPGCECGFKSGTFELKDGLPLMPSHAWLIHATVALVIVETPPLRIQEILEIAKKLMKDVRSQIQPSGDVFYAVTVNNSLRNQCNFSVLATRVNDRVPIDTCSLP